MDITANPNGPHEFDINGGGHHGSIAENHFGVQDIHLDGHHAHAIPRFDNGHDILGDGVHGSTSPHYAGGHNFDIGDHHGYTVPNGDHGMDVFMGGHQIGVTKHNIFGGTEFHGDLGMLGDSADRSMIIAKGLFGDVKF